MILFSQGMNKCDLKGRKCIETSSSKTYNCRTTCVGIYADVQWREMLLEEDKAHKEKNTTSKLQEEGEDTKLHQQLADLRMEMKQLKSQGQGRGEQVDKEKYKMMVAEYRKFKAKTVKHFKLNGRASSNSFGKLKNQFESRHAECQILPNKSRLPKKTT